jgi:hypothetical protein
MAAGLLGSCCAGTSGDEVGHGTLSTLPLGPPRLRSSVALLLETVED